MWIFAENCAEDVGKNLGFEETSTNLGVRGLDHLHCTRHIQISAVVYSCICWSCVGVSVIRFLLKDCY